MTAVSEEAAVPGMLAGFSLFFGIIPADVCSRNIKAVRRIRPNRAATNRFGLMTDAFVESLNSQKELINQTLIADFHEHFTKIVAFEKADKRPGCIFQTRDNGFLPLDLTVGNPFAHVVIKLP